MGGVDADREAVKQGSILERDVIGERVDVRFRRFGVFAEAPGPPDSDVVQLRAEMVIAGNALPTHSALQQRFNGHPVARLDTGHIERHHHHGPAEFVPEHLPEDARGELGHAVRIEVNVAAANAGDMIAKENLSRSELRIRNVPDLQRPGRDENCGSHHGLLSMDQRIVAA
jgi:hypothetical protein